MNGGRVATASGAILADAAFVEAVVEAARAGAGPAIVADSLFEPQFWTTHGRMTPVDRGRGAAWFIDHGTEQWVLRHYRRGGWVARLSRDRYLWTGEVRVRAFAEFRLLATLVAQGLPVPVPIAARYHRQGIWYRCDLITRRIAGAAALSGMLTASPLSDASWRRIGSTVARLHFAGADHADLNAHNILIDERGAVSVVDFDRGRLRRAGPEAERNRPWRTEPKRAWAAGNLRRLRRSLVKISADLPPDRFSDDAWRSLEAGYAERAEAAQHAEPAERAAADE
jgi:3-deoxy-D-manno-octulosonic acid kinase